MHTDPILQKDLITRNVQYQIKQKTNAKQHNHRQRHEHHHHNITQQVATEASQTIMPLDFAYSRIYKIYRNVVHW